MENSILPYILEERAKRNGSSCMKDWKCSAKTTGTATICFSLPPRYEPEVSQAHSTLFCCSLSIGEIGKGGA